MTTDASGYPLKIAIEALDPKKHDREGFACGIDRLDNFIKRSANKQQIANITRVFVASEVGAPGILGYYALNAHGLEPDGLSDDAKRGLPPARPIPAIYLSMIAVSSTAQGQGIGTHLMVDAFIKTIEASERVGVKLLVLDVLDDGQADEIKKRTKFYEVLGFVSIPTEPLRMFITVKDLLAAREQASS